MSNSRLMLSWRLGNILHTQKTSQIWRKVDSCNWRVETGKDESGEISLFPEIFVNNDMAGCQGGHGVVSTVQGDPRSLNGCWWEHRCVKAKILDKSKFWDLSAINPARSRWSSDSLLSNGPGSQSWCPLPCPPGVCATSCCHSGLVPGPEWSPSSGHGVLQGWAEQSRAECSGDCPHGKRLDGLKGCYARTSWM